MNSAPIQKMLWLLASNQRLGVILLLALAVHAPAGLAETQSGAVAGRVFDALSGQVLPGANVSATWTLLEKTATLQQSTNSSGEFEIKGIPVGSRIRVRAASPGYLVGQYGQRTPDDIGTSVSITGEVAKRFDLRLWPLGALAGRILDENYRPVKGVRVRLLRRGTIAGRERWVAGPIVLSNDQGGYRFVHLPAGAYAVQVISIHASVDPSAASLRPEQLAMAFGSSVLLLDGPAKPPRVTKDVVELYPPTFFPGVHSLPEASPIALATSEIREAVDLVIRPVRASSVTGRIISSRTDQSVDGLVVKLVARGNDGIAEGMETAVTLVRNGSFLFPLVPIGDYAIEVNSASGEYSWLPPGSSRASLPPKLGGTGATTRFAVPFGMQNLTGISQARPEELWGQVSLSVGQASPVQDLSIAVASTVTLRGTITLPPSQPNSPPSVSSFAGIRVTVEPADGRLDAGVSSTQVVASDSSQGFVLRGLRPGSYVVRVGGGLLVERVVWKSQDFTNTPLELGSGEDQEGLHIELAREGAQILGLVRNTSGEPSDQATIVCFPVETAQWTLYGTSSPRIRSTTVDSLGRYRLSPLPSGDYYVAALASSKDENWQDASTLRQLQLFAKKVAIAVNAPGQVDLVIRNQIR